MYDPKVVRRRRAVLALLVGLSLILLTAYFRETAGGALHAVQRGVLEVTAPVQDGASRALKPAKDLVGWTGDTLHAKSKLKKVEAERDALRREVIGAEVARNENRQLRALVGLDRNVSLGNQVTARVIGRSPTVWYSTITIDKGRSDGLRVDQPVITGEGLVGKVTEVTGNAAQVTLITDHTSGVSAEIPSANGANGVVHTAVGGNPNDLLLDYVTSTKLVRKGQRVVTSGSRSNRLESLFPPGIPIGWVTKIDSEELDLFRRVHIKPFADLRGMDFVQVLTQPQTAPASQRAQVP